MTEGKFILIKHDIIAGTFSVIMNQPAATWGINAWGATKQRCYNSKIVDGNLIFTDNVNDIRMINVDRMEATYNAGITTAATIFNEAYALATGYTIDTKLYYLDRVYNVIQDPIGVSGTPLTLPLYYSDIASIIDIYLDPLDPDNYTLAALPPLSALTATYLPDPTSNINQLRGKTWQFTYQYVYMDYRKSTFAPPSTIPIPDQEETITGKPNTDPTHNNNIKITLNSGGEDVRYIRIAARSSEDVSTWFIIEEFYCVNNNNYRIIEADTLFTVNFTNNKIGDVLQLSEVYNLFSSVPIKAKHMELIEGNRLVFGNITEGYGKISSDVDIDLEWEDLEGITTQLTELPIVEAYRTSATPGGYRDWQLIFILPPSDPGAAEFTIRMIIPPSSSYESVSYTYDGITAYPSSVITGLLNAMDAKWNEPSTCFIPTTYTFCYFPYTVGIFLPDPYTDWQMEFYYTTGAVTNINRYQTLKTGATHNWGIIYRDIAGRITPVIGADDITKYIPFATEWLATTTAAPSTTAGATTTGGTTTAVATTTAAPSLTNAGKRPLITFNINHLPPPQAVTYEIVYAGNKSVSWYLHLLGYNFTYGKITHDEVGSSTLSDVYRLRIDKAQTRTRGNLHNWSVEEYVWQKGDRIRIFGKVDEAGILTEISEAIYDVEITGVFTDTDTNTKIGETTDPSTNEWIYFPKNTNIAFTPTTGLSPNEFVDNLWVEIYRPFTVETNLFFTTGMTFEIATDGFGNRYHKGDIDQIVDINGISTTPASITNTSHDGWKYQRNFRNVYDNLSFALWAESEYASDFYISNKLTSQGNPVADVDSQQQNVLTKRLRHGGMINVGSQINLIADFDYDDYLDLKDEDGPIEGLRLVGFVLKVLQYTKVVSIYIGRKESFSASGDAQYLFTDNIFGSVRPAMEDWGTRHPSSVTVHNRHLYFWDESEGIVVRDAANGMEVISDNKMKRYFHDKAVALRAYATQHNVWVEFAFSQATNELVCLFGTGSGTQEIITFSEDDQRWKNQFDIAFERDIMYSIGKRLFQTVSAKVYEWWVGSGYNRLTGVQVTPKLVIYAILDPAKVKTFESIIVYQNGGRPQFNNIQIPEKATAGAEAMQTNIYDVNITEKEGVFYCQILRDINTPGVGTQAYKEMNGRKMRGLFARIEMKPQNALSLTGKVTISNIIVLSTPSERSK